LQIDYVKNLEIEDISRINRCFRVFSDPSWATFRMSNTASSRCLQFDYLKSLEIEEKINKIRWCPTANGSRFLLSTNDKTVKLWKVFEKKVKCVSNFNFEPRNGGVGSAGASPAASPGRTGMGSPAHRKAAAVVKDDWVFPPGGIPQLRLPTVRQPCLVSLFRGCCSRIWKRTCGLIGGMSSRKSSVFT
jgi:WD40 repeat protein